MKILRAVLSGYGPFVLSQEFRWSDRGLVLVLGENQDEPRMSSNGSGKSSLFDAVDWALFGEIPKGDHVDSIIHDESKIAVVTVDLFDEDAGRPIVVKRTKERGKATRLQVLVGGEDRTTLDLAETQRLLEVELGLDREVFHATAFFSQTDSFNFAEATESKRMELLSRILPELATIDGWGEVAKAREAKLQLGLSVLENAMATAQARVAELTAQVVQAEEKAAQWDAERAARQAAKAAEGKRWREALERDQARLVGENEARAALVQAEAVMVRPQVDIRDLEAALSEERRRQANWLSTYSSTAANAQAAEQALRKVQGQRVGVCSQCGQMVTADHLAREVDRLRAAHALVAPVVAEAQAQEQAARQAVAVLEDRKREMISRADALFREAQTQVATLRRAVGCYDQIRAAVTNGEQALAVLRAEWAAVGAEVNPWMLSADGQRTRIAELQLLTVAQEAERSIRREEIAYAAFWVAAFANKGLKNYVLDLRLGELSDAANQWVKLLTGGTIWVRFETQKMGRSTKRLSNDVSIRVFRFNPNGSVTERNFKSWSGGEKRRVSWAIDFGLSRLIAARATKRWDVLVLDEAFKHVDSAGGEALVEMLQSLRKERTSIFVIEHNADFQAHFEQRVLVKKCGGSSTILEQEIERGAEIESGIQSANGGTGGEQAQRDPEKPKRAPRRRGVPAGGARAGSDGGGGGGIAG